MTIVNDACTINVLHLSLAYALAYLALSITIVSDAPNCGATYDRHYDDHNSFIIQATGGVITTLHIYRWIQQVTVLHYSNLARDKQ
jgi:hypothetical protein